MSSNQPHFLLFSDSQRPTSPRAAGGTWRFVIESLDGGVNFAITDSEPETCPERLALLAVVRGLEALDQPSRVTLLTTSRYVRRGLRFGLPQWRDNQWQWEHFGGSAPVDNADLWRRIDRAMRIHDVSCRLWRIDGAAQQTVPAPKSARAFPAARHAPQRVPAGSAAGEGWLRRILARAARGIRTALGTLWENESQPAHWCHV
jgi:ribonuclease HI